MPVFWKERMTGKGDFIISAMKTIHIILRAQLGLQTTSKESGAEIQPTEKVANGKLVKSPAKIASIVSSSAMLFNLMDDDPVAVTSLIECI